MQVPPPKVTDDFSFLLNLHKSNLNPPQKKEEKKEKNPVLLFQIRHFLFKTHFLFLINPAL
jgi:hypothetical protein